MLPFNAWTQGAPGVRGGSVTSISRTVMGPLTGVLNPSLACTVSS